MSGITQYDKPEYYSNLSGKETTDDWDILVSYSEAQLNHLLDQIWGSKKLFSNLSFSHDFGTKSYPIVKTYTFTLASPVLAFGELDGNPRAFLKMGFSGQVSIKAGTGNNPPDITEIPADAYFLNVSVPLASFSATEDEFHDGKTVIQFESPGEKNTAHHIVFHFKNQESRWDFSAVDPNNPGPLLEDLLAIKGDVAVWFESQAHVTWIDYSLSKISNQEDPTSTLLRPKSYKFVSSSGVLNVFIQTEGSGNPPGNANNTGFGRQYDHFDFSPIPKDYTGCIILSKNLFLRKFLIEQIKSHLSSTLVPSGGVIEENAAAGASLKLRYEKKTAIRGGTYSHGEGQASYGIDPLVVDFQDNPVTIQFFDETPYTTPKYRWKWLFKGSTNYTIISKFPVYSTAEIESKVPERTKALAAATGYNIDFDINFDSGDQPSTYFTNGNLSVVKPHVSFHEFKIALPQLNFFSTQNIFAPGERFINVSDLMFPSDFILLGHMPDTPQTV
ncbi:hypothetical protein FQN49_000302 [Arthroderma sp. PD_2]|nr:hypothetical protein FQN49_000302 [Arthroderma sp. PD_2]